MAQDGGVPGRGGADALKKIGAVGTAAFAAFILAPDVAAMFPTEDLGGPQVEQGTIRSGGAFIDTRFPQIFENQGGPSTIEDAANAWGIRPDLFAGTVATDLPNALRYAAYQAQTSPRTDATGHGVIPFENPALQQLPGQENIPFTFYELSLNSDTMASFTREHPGHKLQSAVGQSMIVLGVEENGPNDTYRVVVNDGTQNRFDTLTVDEIKTIALSNKIGFDERTSEMSRWVPVEDAETGETHFEQEIWHANFFDKAAVQLIDTAIADQQLAVPTAPAPTLEPAPATPTPPSVPNTPTPKPPGVETQVAPTGSEFMWNGSPMRPGMLKDNMIVTAAHTVDLLAGQVTKTTKETYELNGQQQTGWFVYLNLGQNPSDGQNIEGKFLIGKDDTNIPLTKTVALAADPNPSGDTSGNTVGTAAGTVAQTLKPGNVIAIGVEERLDLSQAPPNCSEIPACVYALETASLIPYNLALTQQANGQASSDSEPANGFGLLNSVYLPK